MTETPQNAPQNPPRNPLVAEGRIFVGGGGEGHVTPQYLLLKYANRHGLIAGATGTGKTVTLQTLAESLSTAGVPVFMADVKGDLAGMSMPGDAAAKFHEGFAKRAEQIGAPLDYQAFPTVFWDLYGEQGHPIRATVAEMGPLLLSRLMGLSEAQEGVLNIAFRIADEEGLALLDLKDLQSMLVWCGENAKDIGLRYGNITPQSVGAIQRQLLVMENQGATAFFGEPALDLADMMGTDADGRGRINILAADKLMNAPRLYATFLLWMLSELFERLPEVGDPDQPNFVFFFDEAHLLFDDAPKSLVDKVEQVARLIRSKGVGVYFVTQNPADVPEAILGQLGNRVQHALRAFTAKDQKALEMAAENYRLNPDFDIADAIREVGTGEAVTSFLEAKGIPGIAQRTLVRPPLSRMGPITAEERAAVVARSPFGAKYDWPVDRESAHEILSARASQAAQQAARNEDLVLNTDFRKARRYEAGDQDEPAPRARTTRATSRNDSLLTAFGKSMARQIGNQAGQAVIRGILGSLFRGK